MGVWVLLGLFCYSLWAAEGLFLPSDKIFPPAILKSVESVVKFENSACGIVIAPNLILTARHVLPHAICTSGAPSAYQHKVEVSTTAGKILGETQRVLYCGDFLKTKTERIKRLKLSLGPKKLKQWNGFTLDEDIAILEVKWQGTPPVPIPLAKENPKLGEGVFVLGYPAQTDRHLNPHENYLGVFANFHLAVSHLIQKAKNTPDLKSFLETLEGHALEWVAKLPYYVDAGEVETFYQAALAHPLQAIITRYREDYYEEISNTWAKGDAQAQGYYYRELVIEDLEEIEAVLDGIRYGIVQSHRANIDFRDADGSLRISEGNVVGFETHPFKGKEFNLLTDADGAGGNSGGPVLNCQGELISLTSGGTSGTQYAYVPYVPGSSFSRLDGTGIMGPSITTIKSAIKIVTGR